MSVYIVVFEPFDVFTISFEEVLKACIRAEKAQEVVEVKVFSDKEKCYTFFEQNASSILIAYIAINFDPDGEWGDHQGLGFASLLKESYPNTLIYVTIEECGLDSRELSRHILDGYIYKGGSWSSFMSRNRQVIMTWKKLAKTLLS